MEEISQYKVLVYNMSINEISNFKVSDEVEIVNNSELVSMLNNLAKMKQLLVDAQTLANNAKSYSLSWEGEAKLAYDSFTDFIDWYNRDLTPAIDAYEGFIKVINEEVGELSRGDSNVLQEFSNVPRI